MKIVDKKTFLSMPANTVFSKYEPCFFGDLSIKGDSLPNDFFCQQIVDAIDYDDSVGFIERLKVGGNLKMNFDCEKRDGLFVEDQLFAVWEKEDVEKLIDRLKKCLG